MTFEWRFNVVIFFSDSAGARARNSEWRGVVHSWPGQGSSEQFRRSPVPGSGPEATWLGANQRTSRYTPNSTPFPAFSDDERGRGWVLVATAPSAPAKPEARNAARRITMSKPGRRPPPSAPTHWVQVPVLKKAHNASISPSTGTKNRPSDHYTASPSTHEHFSFYSHAHHKPEVQTIHRPLPTKWTSPPSQGAYVGNQFYPVWPHPPTSPPAPPPPPQIIVIQPADSHTDKPAPTPAPTPAAPDAEGTKCPQVVVALTNVHLSRDGCPELHIVINDTANQGSDQRPSPPPQLAPPEMTTYPTAPMRPMRPSPPAAAGGGGGGGGWGGGLMGLLSSLGSYGMNFWAGILITPIVVIAAIGTLMTPWILPFLIARRAITRRGPSSTRRKESYAHDPVVEHFLAHCRPPATCRPRHRPTVHPRFDPTREWWKLGDDT